MQGSATVIELAPSILSANFAQLGVQALAALEGGGTVLHLDVMDGHFVPNLTTGGPMVRFGTKCPSMTSRCSTVPPPSSAASACTPSCAKLAERMEGASSITVALPCIDYTLKRALACSREAWTR